MYYEEMHIGQKQEGTWITVTEAHIVTFGSLTGDLSPFHMNDEYMKQTPFGQRIAHGMLTASLAVPSVRYFTAGQGATHLEEHFVFRSPVFIGDTIRTECEIIKLQPKSKWGVVQIKLVVKNQKGEVVMEGTSTLGVHFKPK